MRVFLTILFCIIFLRSFSQEADSVQVAVADSSKVYELNEVVATSDNIIHKLGYDLLILRKENKKFGTNALDAISSLNEFETKLNGTGLTTYDKASVFIVINGVPSDGYDLRGFKADDIKSIKYYRATPAKYMALTSGPVIDVILKKPHDQLYSGYFNTSNAVNTLYGTDQAVLSYRDSLNMVRVNFLTDYRDLKKLDIDKSFIYPDGKESYYHERQHYKGSYNRLSGSYQYFGGGHLFNAALTYKFSPGDQNANGEATFIDGINNIKTPSFSSLKSDDKTGTMSLYYSYTWKNTRMFALNVVNSLGKSWSNSLLETNSYENHPEDIIESYIHNDSYRFSAEAFFAVVALGGQLSVGNQYSYNYLNQKYFESCFKPIQNQNTTSLSGYWTVNNFYIQPTVSLLVTDQKTLGLHYTNIRPTFRYITNWWPTGALKGFSIQLSLNASRMDVPLELLTTSPTFLDFNFSCIGNPNLKSYTNYSERLTFRYGRGRNLISFSTNCFYKPNRYGLVLESINDMPVLTYTNYKYDFAEMMFLQGTWSPVSWLQISPYLEYYIFKVRAANDRVNTSYFRYGGSVTFSKDSWDLQLCANSPVKEFDGLMMKRGGAQYAAIFQYKISNWALGAEYHYSPGTEASYIRNKYIDYMNSTTWLSAKNLFQINVIYSFSIGRARNHAQKFLQDSEASGGLNQFNNAHKL